MPRKPEQTWFVDAVKAVVRERKTLRQYVAENGLELTATECERVGHSKKFQELLWAERQVYQTEIANTPGRNKTSLVGLATIVVQHLVDDGQWDKAIVAIEKLAKIEGFLGAESNINIFAGITAQDIDKMKAELSAAEGSKALLSTSQGNA